MCLLSFCLNIASAAQPNNSVFEMSAEVEYIKPSLSEVCKSSKRPSKIPVRNKQALQQGTPKDTSHVWRKRTKSAEKPSSVLASKHTGAKVRSRHGSDKSRKGEMSSSLGSKELKENIAPSLSSSSTSIILPNRIHPKG